MDSKSFLKEIRSIIREEIEYALKKQQNESKKKSTNETIQQGLSMYQKVQKPVEKKKPQPSGNFSSIQDILNETRRTLEESSDMENEFRFTSDNVQGHSSNYGAIPSGISPDEIAPEVAQALTRDYSALMAKINEKKGS
jgi:hypothetical protein